MKTQWHPLFAHLLGLLVQEHYEVQTEVPVSDLPRAGDILLVRRQPGASPPFHGLWGHLTDWNVLELKGPTDDAEADDLELLMHVGAGITVRLNEERRSRGEPRLAARQVSFWYLAPTLGETFIGHARGRTAFDYETNGLWTGRAWGHTVRLVAYRDLPAEEEDSLPLLLLRRDTAPPVLGELLARQPDLAGRYAKWMVTLQPDLWKEVRRMASASTGGIPVEWEKVAELVDLDEIIPYLSPEQVVEKIGIERAVEAVGLPKVIEKVGLAKVIEAVGREKLLQHLLADVPAEQVEEVVRRAQQRPGPRAPDAGAGL